VNPQSVEIFDKFAFSKSGVETITFKSGSALKGIEGMRSIVRTRATREED
jgi:hypothetical protein